MRAPLRARSCLWLLTAVAPTVICLCWALVVGGSQLFMLLPSAPDDARFEISSLPDTAIVIDSRSGRSWMLKDKVGGERAFWQPLRTVGDRMAAPELTEPGAIRRVQIGRQARVSLRSMLERIGYTRVSLKRTSFGLLVASAKFEGVNLSLALDTGSPQTKFDQRTVEALGLSMPTLPRATGTNQRDDSSSQTLFGSLELESFKTHELHVGMYDLSERNRQITERFGEPPIDGLLGQDVIDAHLAIVDYVDCNLFLRARGGSN